MRSEGKAVCKIAGLPKYHSKATANETAVREMWRARQEALIDEQIEAGTPAQHIKIRCNCNCFSSWREMIRCLYCGVWFCEECAQQHFGYRK